MNVSGKLTTIIHFVKKHLPFVYFGLLSKRPPSELPLMMLMATHGCEYFYMESEENAMNTPGDRKTTLTESEFCKAVGISRTTAWRMREAGKLSFCRIGDKVLYLPRHVDEFLANCERRAKESS